MSTATVTMSVISLILLLPKQYLPSQKLLDSRALHDSNHLNIWKRVYSLQEIPKTNRSKHRRIRANSKKNKGHRIEYPAEIQSIIEITI